MSNAAKRLTKTDLHFIQGYLVKKLQEEKYVKRGEVFEQIDSDLPKTSFCESLSHNIKNGKLAGFKIVRGLNGGITIDDLEAAKVCLKQLELEIKAVGVPSEEVKVQAKPEADDDFEQALKDLASAEAKHAEGKKIEPKKAKSKAEPKDGSYLSAKPTSNRSLSTTKTHRLLWIKDSKYSVPLTTTAIDTFLIKVLKVQSDPEGIIVFDGKRYSGDEKLLHRFLTLFVGAGIPTTSEPILDTTDVNGIPINLIDGIKTPQDLEDWNKEQGKAS